MLGLPWRTVPVDDGPCHVVPEHDNRAHALTADCWCCPTEDECGTIVHNSWDGRELFERGERLVS